MKETQKSVHGWCKAMFPGYVGVKGRAVALIEEAVELSIAAGVPYDTIRAAVEVPILKETVRMGSGQSWNPNADREEVADVLVCVYAYAEEAGYDAHQELDEKMELNRSRSMEYYAKKTAEKMDKGFILPPPIR
jgi:NTP pyrophosphatase (non-canonical NTP hydrolase)